MCLEPTTSGENREYEIAIITWIDIEDRSSPGWVPWEQAIADASEPFQPVLTTGVVIFEDEEKLSLTASVGPDETSGAISIPKGVILTDHRHMVEVKKKAAPPSG